MNKRLSALTIAAAATFALPAVADETMTSNDVDFFYAEIEGGFAFFDGAGVGLVHVNLPSEEIVSAAADTGWSGTVTLGHVSIENGILNGFVDRAEMWFTYSDQGKDTITDVVTLAFLPSSINDGNNNYSQTANDYAASVERDYFEVGARFQHYADQNASDKMIWGLEPFVGFMNESTRAFPTNSPTQFRVSELDATLAGVLLSFEGEWHVHDRTVWFARAAAGGYFGEADATVAFDVAVNPDGASRSFGGFRGQLALGLTQHLTARTAVSLVGRLDYFSDVPLINFAENTPPERNRIDTDGLVELFVGVNFKYVFAGTYQ